MLLAVWRALERSNNGKCNFLYPIRVLKRADDDLGSLLVPILKYKNKKIINLNFFIQLLRFSRMSHWNWTFFIYKIAYICISNNERSTFNSPRFGFFTGSSQLTLTFEQKTFYQCIIISYTHVINIWQLFFCLFWSYL